MAKKYRAIDFFCGGGGMTYGLRQAGIDVLAGVDFDKDAKETYELNNPGSTFILSDIKRLRSNYFERKFNLAKNDDHLILVGCSPCQFYSRINTTKEKSKQSKDLLDNFFRFIKYYNPGYVIVENVPGLKTNKESILPKFIKYLKKHKYTIKEEVVDLSYYGIPQTRERFTLIASRVSDKIILPKKQKNRAIIKDYISIENGFPKIDAATIDKSDFMHTSARLEDINLKRLRATRHNGGGRHDWKDNAELQLPCYIGKDSYFTDNYGRMSWDKPSPTITTKFYSISNGRFGHPDQDRGMSLREGATLQTFPITYIFKHTNMAAIAKLIGNAVPPEYARQLGEIITNLSDE